MLDFELYVTYMNIGQYQDLKERVCHKVKKFFEQYPVPAHDFGHAERVAHWAKYIAETEKARSPELCELSGLLHDIGRVPEQNGKGNGKKHHELSYELLRTWYHEDAVFTYLDDAEKIELLYAIRYHYNDEANAYDTAWILRDADKLDVLGEIGLQRMKEFFGDDKEKIDKNLRNVYQIIACMRTGTAKRLIQEHRLVEPIDDFRRELLRETILPIEL